MCYLARSWYMVILVNILKCFINGFLARRRLEQYLDSLWTVCTWLLHGSMLLTPLTEIRRNFQWKAEVDCNITGNTNMCCYQEHSSYIGQQD